MTIAEIKKALECCHTMAVECDECPIHNRKGDWTDGKDCDDVLHDEILKVWDNMVQVVRCRECKYAHLTNDDDIKYCDLLAVKDEYGDCDPCFYRSGYWFCADGERKEHEDV